MKMNELLANEYACTEAFILMSYTDALPSQWRKTLKYTKRKSTSTDDEEAQTLMKNKTTKITKLTQKTFFTKSDFQKCILITTLNGTSSIKFHLR